MFIGVMTFLLFGVMSATLHGSTLTVADKVLMWGVSAGIVGFGLGLMTVTQWLKRVSTPVMGAALLYGIWVYIQDLRRAPAELPTSESSEM